MPPGATPPGATPVGRVLGAFGLRGEAKVAPIDASDFREGLVVDVIGADGAQRRMTVTAVRPHKNQLLVRFEGLSDAAQVEALRGALLVALESQLPPLQPGVYRDKVLIGMRVNDARLGSLGDVREVLHYPHADMLVVGERSLMIPMLAAYGMVIDVDARTIATDLPPGFEDL